MAAHNFLQDFLIPLDKSIFNNDEKYDDAQLGSLIDVHESNYFPDTDNASLIILGAGEERGEGGNKNNNEAPDAIRVALYQLFHWHPEITVADIGNIISGATLEDSYAALKTVVAELNRENKTVIILGGSHDLTLPQYESYSLRKQLTEITIIDALINLQEDAMQKADGFLMDIFLEEPNFLQHYNHIGFQSYYVQPHILETLDKLRFDCYRVGRARELLDDMEPVIRQSNLLSIDISAMRHADAPANSISPNGFFGDEMCTLTRYAGMAAQLSSVGFYGYHPQQDKEQLTAKQIAQMIWYFIEGRFVRNKEAKISERDSFLEFHVAFTDVETLFLKSKKTGRWWMQLPDKHFIPCAYKDYLTASNNEIPERWLRAQERL